MTKKERDEIIYDNSDKNRKGKISYQYPDVAVMQIQADIAYQLTRIADVLCGREI